VSTTEEITSQILQAWDEIVEGDTPPSEPPAVPATPEPESPAEEPAPEEEEETGEEEEGATVESPAEEEAPAPEEEGTEEEQPEVETEEPEEEVESGYDTDDPEARAFLSKYQGDVTRALKGGLQMQQALSRLGTEKQALEARVSELENELVQAQGFGGDAFPLSPEQREWVGQALESGNPAMFVRQAVAAGEFALARVVCNEWGNEAPYEALRVANAVDAAEAQVYQMQQQQMDTPLPVDGKAMLDALTVHFPEIPQYAQQMQDVMTRLGPEHPTVKAATSGDARIAMPAVVDIYEIARASTHALSSTREKIKSEQREEGDSARKKAVVSSSGSAPTPSESARPQKLGPGLTLEQLEEEWERNK
jgi:hypothetical protein